MDGGLFLLALVITIEPLPVIAFILTLSTRGGARNGIGFLVGWVVCMVAIFVAVVGLSASQHAHHSGPSGAASAVVTLLVGLALLGWGLNRRRHPPEGPPPPPSWAKRVDDLSVVGAAVLGLLIQPWGLLAVGAAQIHDKHLSAAAEIGTLVVFGLVSTASLLVMEGLTLASPERTRDRLGRLRAWIERHRRGALTGLLLVAGVWLAVQGTYTLIAG